MLDIIRKATENKPFRHFCLHMRPQDTPVLGWDAPGWECRLQVLSFALQLRTAVGCCFHAANQGKDELILALRERAAKPVEDTIAHSIDRGSDQETRTVTSC